MALFVGGAAQFLAGMWEFACGNTFGATGKFRIPKFLPFRKFVLLTSEDMFVFERHKEIVRKDKE